MPLPAFADPVFPTIPMAVTLPGRDRERLARALAASAIRRPLSPADLRFPDATENGFARTLAPSTHLQTHPLRPALPPRDRKRLAHPLAASAIRRPLSLADLRFLCATENGSSALLPRLPIADPLPVDRRFPVRPRTDCPHSCRVRHSQALSPADLRFSPPRDRERSRARFLASAGRRPAPFRHGSGCPAAPCGAKNVQVLQFVENRPVPR